MDVISGTECKNSSVYWSHIRRRYELVSSLREGLSGFYRVSVTNSECKHHNNTLVSKQRS